MHKELAAQSCAACAGAVAPLATEKQQELLVELPEWQIIEGHHLERHYVFKNFKQALAFVNQVGAVAETEKHHPDIFFTWGKATIRIMTHSVDGLTEADFILAAKISAIS